MRKTDSHEQLKNHLVACFAQVADARTRARTLEEERTTRTLRPTVIIGLGGAGCGIGARLKRSLHRYYQNLQSARDMLQFLMLDTESLQRHRDSAISETFASDAEYLFLGGFSPREWVRHHRDHDDDLRRWWPDTAGLEGTNISDGCRRIRPLGRLCLYNHRAQVQAAINRALNSALELSREANANLDLTPLDEDAALSVHVISGSCGGTGSGMLLDVLTMVRRALREVGHSSSKCTAVIVMPSFYRNLGDTVSEPLKHARGANGYAFLRELQHFAHHPDQWKDFCLDSLARARSDADIGPDTDAPAQSIYLLDDEIAGRTIGSLDEVYGLAADALFHKLTSPVAAGSVDLNLHLARPDRDRVRAFSSMGISYILYPRKTIARCAGSAALRDLLDAGMRRPLSADDRETAQQEAERLMRDLAELLDAREVARTLAGETANLRNSLPSVTQLQEEARKPGSSRPKLATAMRKAEQSAQNAMGRASRLIADEAAAFRKAAQNRIIENLANAVLRAIGEHPIEWATEMLTRLTRLIEEAEAEIPTGAERADAVAARTGELSDYIRQVESLELNRKLDLMEKSRINSVLTQFVEALRTRFSAQATEDAGRAARLYRTEVAAPTAQEFAERCRRMLEEITILRGALDALAATTNVATDEHNLPITTQLVPKGGVEEVVRTVTEAMGGTGAAASNLAPQLAANGRLWRLTDPDPNVRAQARMEAAEAITKWICDQEALDSALKRDLKTAIEELGSEYFVKEVLPQAVKLADPTWREDTSRVGGDLVPEKEMLANYPPDFPKELLTADLRRSGREQRGSLEDHRMVILRVEHGLPLHALGNISTLREDYRKHLNRDKQRKEPPHIARDWNANPDSLEDVMPEGREALLEMFALGVFSDWLVTKKQHAEASAIITGWKNGVIYERTPNQYYIADLEQRGNRVTLTDERHLAGGRSQAAEAFSASDVKSVCIFRDRLTNAIGEDQVRQLIAEYCRDVLETQAAPRSNSAEHLKVQYKRELEALRKYAGLD